MLPQGKKGFVLVLALVTMLAMTIIGLSVVMNMTTDMQLSRNERDAKLAFQLAEAGINEAIARLHLPTSSDRHIGELTGDANYRTTSWNSDGLKNFGFGNGDADRESADDLNYTVTINYLDESNPEGFCDNNAANPNNSGNATSPPPSGSCNSTPNEIVMFGKDFVMGSLTNISYGKQPVYRIVSTGTSNGTSRTIESYVGASNLNTDTEYGINTNGCIDANGASGNLGQVKQGVDATTGVPCACDPSAKGVGSCAANKPSSDDMNTYLGPDIADVIDFADETHKCTNGTCSAAGDDIPSSGKIDDVVLDWGDAGGNTYSTMVYIDNPGKEVEISGNFTGRGILIVTGSLKLSGSLQYEGLIYVFGDLRLSGGGSNLNVLGGVMANSTVTAGGNVTVTYDQPTLLDVSKENSTSNFILWKRL